MTHFYLFNLNVTTELEICVSSETPLTREEILAKACTDDECVEIGISESLPTDISHALSAENKDDIEIETVEEEDED